MPLPDVNGKLKDLPVIGTISTVCETVKNVTERPIETALKSAVKFNKVPLASLGARSTANKSYPRTPRK